MRWMIRLLLVVGIGSGFATGMYASDGMLEINQICATQTGCFPGDGAGFPVLITQPGSYRLTGNLQVPNENTTGILIGIENVVVDLGGFAIRGNVVCSGSPTTCTPTNGSGIGVQAGLARVRVRNGTIVGMGLRGVQTGPDAVVEDVQVAMSGLEGITSAGFAGGEFRNNTSTRNGWHGLSVIGAVVVGNHTAANGRHGIAASQSTVTGNVSHNNGWSGIRADESTISANQAYANTQQGIESVGGLVAGNIAKGNGGLGIYAPNGTNVSGNVASGNTSGGLQLTTDSAYRDNVVVQASGTTVSGGTNLGGNLCSLGGAAPTACP